MERLSRDLELDRAAPGRAGGSALRAVRKLSVGQVIAAVPLSDCCSHHTARLVLPREQWARELPDELAVTLALATQHGGESCAATVLQWPESALAGFPRGSSTAATAAEARAAAAAARQSIRDSGAEHWVSTCLPDGALAWAQGELLRRAVKLNRHGAPGLAVLPSPLGFLGRSTDAPNVTLDEELAEGNSPASPTSPEPAGPERWLRLRAARDLAAGELLYAPATALWGSSPLSHRGFHDDPGESAEVRFSVGPSAAALLRQRSSSEGTLRGCTLSQHGDEVSCLLTIPDPLPPALLSVCCATAEDADALLERLRGLCASDPGPGGAEGAAAARAAEHKALLRAVALLELRSAIAEGAETAVSSAVDFRDGGAACGGKVVRGQPLALCPLRVVLASEQQFGALAQPLTDGGEVSLGERQMHMLHLLWERDRRGGDTSWAPVPRDAVINWAAPDLLQLRGTELCKDGAATPRDAALSDAKLLRHALREAQTELRRVADCDDALLWAAGALDARQVTVTIPDCTVRVSLADVAPPPDGVVCWTDEDGDKVAVRAHGKEGLIYSVNGEDRPPTRTVALIGGGAGLAFTDIDRELDLPAASPEDFTVFRATLGGVRALATSTSMQCSIPPSLALQWSGRELSAVVPGISLFPHRHEGRPPRVVDTGAPVGLCISALAHADLAKGDTAGVCYGHLTSAALLRAHGVVHPQGLGSTIELTQKVPCRPMGAPETPDDTLHGLVLQGASVWAELGEPVRVDLPDLDQLQAGAAGLMFTICHTLSSADPLPRSLIACETLAHFSRDRVAAVRPVVGSPAGLEQALAGAQDERREALRSVTQRVRRRLDAYPTSLADDERRLASGEALQSRARSALLLRIGEKRVLHAALSAAAAAIEADPG
eukprot:TRINITY_DN28001_c0_g1_i3.p1 TRINITY_DN28001_c0_g1~~TRINITY_DN28001_c0_g1_i3.p1  ORF type:complete len:893 (+),score=182.46 TRINITY_DN28001_c0_g1_i3:72-2750(+)